MKLKVIPKDFSVPIKENANHHFSNNNMLIVIFSYKFFVKKKEQENIEIHKKGIQLLGEASF